MTTWIGDIGGSSSRWAVIAEGKGSALEGTFPGFNPLTGSPDDLRAALQQAMAGGRHPAPEKVVAYGAGCGARARATRMQEALQAIWTKAEVEVESDLLGAARSLYPKGKGLVLILGTGMNTGHYDGQFLHTPMPSLGYVLGDEGSGADIGRHFLRDALYGLVPEALRARLLPEGLDLPLTLEAVYRSQAPQAFVASFTAKLADFQEDHYVHDLVTSRFFALARLLSLFYASAERRQVMAVGSVAHGFRGLLGTVLAHHGMQLNGARRDPLPGLVEYHLQYPG